MKEDEIFFVGQKAFIKKGDEVLVLRHTTSNKLDFPGGKIQEGENDFIESLKREVREETGLEIEAREPFVTWYNNFPKEHRNAGKKIFLVGYKCEYKSGDVTLSDEHSSYQWVNKDNYQKVKDDSKNFATLEQYFCQKD